MLNVDAEIVVLARDRPREIIEHVVAVVSASDPNVAGSAGIWTEVLLFALGVEDETEGRDNVVSRDARRTAAG